MSTEEETAAPFAVIAIADAAKHTSETVTIRGWLYNLRKSGKNRVSHRSRRQRMMQCVAVKSKLPKRYSKL